MTTNDDDTPEPPIVAHMHAYAEHTVQRVATLLTEAGWDAVLISVTRIVEVAPGEFQAPGATSTVMDRVRCAPVIPHIVAVLRKQADILERSASEEEMPSGYIQDRSDYASGLKEWPK